MLSSWKAFAVKVEFLPPISLMMYRSCSNNALYSAVLSFAMFIFLLTPFETLDCHYFESNVRFVLYLKVLPIKKARDVFCGLLNIKK